jgi:hypothetical protein
MGQVLVERFEGLAFRWSAKGLCTKKVVTMLAPSDMLLTSLNVCAPSSLMVVLGQRDGTVLR